MPFVSLEFILLGVRRIDSIAPKERHDAGRYSCVCYSPADNIGA